MGPPTAMARFHWPVLPASAGLTREGLAHSAIADARMAAGVVNAIAAYHLELLQEQARLKI